ncbi:Regulator of nonsense transcripts upf2 [Homalodisca vitripennis]|nr:Regulator of nonsense transcripts upf2 [Homalodisca vitripennis]
MRMKTGKTLDSRYVTMIENAYYFVNPPELPVTRVKERPIMHEFIRHILYQDLTRPAEAPKVLDFMRRLNWRDQQIFNYAIKCLTQAWNVPYPNIKDLANLLAGLVEYQKCVNNYMSGGEGLRALFAKLTEAVKSAVESAVTNALANVQKEVKKLQDEVIILTRHVGELDERLGERSDELEQYQLRNNIRIFGVEEKTAEDTD